MSLRPQAADYDCIWQKLRETLKVEICIKNTQILRVIRALPVERNAWVCAFSLVYTLCNALPASFFDRLYSDLNKLVEGHLLEILRLVSADDEFEPHTDVDLLKRYENAWVKFRQGVTDLERMFIYFDQHEYHIEETIESVEGNIENEKYSIVEPVHKFRVGVLCCAAWERCVLQPLASRLRSRFVKTVKLLRLDPSTNPDFNKRLRTFVDSTMDVRVDRDDTYFLYKKIVLRPHLKTVGATETRSGHVLLIAAGEVSQYLRLTLDALDQELSLADAFLHVNSRNAVRKRFERLLVIPHLSALFAYAKRFFRTNSTDSYVDMRRLYLLLRPIGAMLLKPLVEIFEEQMVFEGLGLLERRRPPEGTDAYVNFMITMFTLKSKYLKISAEAFDGDRAFVSAVDRGCATCINRLPDSGRMFVEYIDLFLRKHPMGARRRAYIEAIENKLAVKLPLPFDLVRYLDDKDGFEEYYLRALANRLIQRQLYLSLDLEKMMIKYLKLLCRHGFVDKVNRLYTDATLVAKLNANFRLYVQRRTQSRDGDAVPLYVHVFQAGAWPLWSGQSLDAGAPLPQIALLERPLKVFERFYSASFEGRRIVWLQNLCTGELLTRYTSRVYRVVAVAVQCALLLEFDAFDERSEEEVRERMNLSKKKWRNALGPILETGLLTAADDVVGASTSREHAPEMVAMLRLNLAFSSSRVVIRLTCTPSATEKTAEETKPRVQDHRMFLQAAIIRIMKRRRSCTHSDLLREAVAAARGAFRPSVSLIKDCIETLIQKEYMERALDLSDTYLYVA